VKSWTPPDRQERLLWLYGAKVRNTTRRRIAQFIRTSSGNVKSSLGEEYGVRDQGRGCNRTRKRCVHRAKDMLGVSKSPKATRFSCSLAKRGGQALFARGIVTPPKRRKKSGIIRQTAAQPHESGARSASGGWGARTQSVRGLNDGRPQTGSTSIYRQATNKIRRHL